MYHVSRPKRPALRERNPRSKPIDNWRATRARLELRELPPPPWRYTDDTVMALGIVEILERAGRIDADDLARTKGRRRVEVRRESSVSTHTTTAR
jgi:hypothetical protein